MNRAEEKFHEIERFLAGRFGVKLDREFHYAVRAMCVTEIDEKDHEEMFSEFLGMNYDAPVIVGVTYDAGEALKKVDPERYTEELHGFLGEFTMNCGFYYFYEDQLDEMLSFLKSISLDAAYETLFPTELAV
jgi:hypothetical protein